LDTTICIGLSFQLNGIATNGNIFNWEPAILLNNSITLKPIINNPKTGFYKLIVENSDGNCKTADSIKITLDSVKADFTGNITEGNTPLNVQFTNTSITANTYLWNL
jgi:PKD repeat protein